MKTHGWAGFKTACKTDKKHRIGSVLKLLKLRSNWGKHLQKPILKQLLIQILSTPWAANKAPAKASANAPLKVSVKYCTVLQAAKNTHYSIFKISYSVICWGHSTASAKAFAKVDAKTLILRGGRNIENQNIKGWEHRKFFFSIIRTSKVKKVTTSKVWSERRKWPTYGVSTFWFS